MDKKHGEKETTFTDGTKIKLSLSVESFDEKYKFKKIETVCKTANKMLSEILTSFFTEDTAKEIETLLQNTDKVEN